MNHTAGFGFSAHMANFNALHSLTKCKNPGSNASGISFYFAYSTALVSRITLILIWPGYSSSASIFLAMSRARMIMLSSVTSSGLTMMRTSRPAWMANAFSTPGTYIVYLCVPCVLYMQSLCYFLVYCEYIRIYFITRRGQNG